VTQLGHGVSLAGLRQGDCGCLANASVSRRGYSIAGGTGLGGPFTEVRDAIQMSMNNKL